MKSKLRLLLSVVIVFTLTIYVVSKYALVLNVRTSTGVWAVERNALSELGVLEQNALKTGNYNQDSVLRLKAEFFVIEQCESPTVRFYSPLLYVEYLLLGWHRYYFEGPKQFFNKKGFGSFGQ